MDSTKIVSGDQTAFNDSILDPSHRHAVVLI